MNELFMNTETGSIGEYEDWYYTNEDGEEVNAVDLCEVVRVERVDGEWVEVDTIARVAKFFAS